VAAAAVGTDLSIEEVGLTGVLGDHDMAEEGTWMGPSRIVLSKIRGPAAA
jgi:hypothetical protein